VSRALVQSDKRGPRRTYNVLMVAPTSFFADYGCHVRILEEARTLQEMGNRVTICTYYLGRDLPGLDIRRTAPIPWRTHYEVGSSRHKIAFDALLALKTLSVASRARPEIVHGHLHEGALIGYVVSRWLNIPLVFDFQGSMTGEMVDHRFLNPQGRWHRFWRHVEGGIVRLPAATITSSQHAAELLERDFHCPRDKVVPIPDSVNAEYFSPVRADQGPDQLRANLGIPPDRQIVVYLGLLAEWQGTGLLLQAAKHVLARRSDVQFLIMGYPAVEAYRAQAVALGLDSRVTFTGKIPYEQAPAFLSLGDVAVAPKISSTEGSGKLLNYMSMGLPTVAFDVPVSREYLDAWGIYARVGDAVSLADNLDALLADREHGRRLGECLRQRAIEHYSWATAGARIMDVYDRVSRQ
jgi:glycosyltransferase involved in cell wall biosynthesis